MIRSLLLVLLLAALAAAEDPFVPLDLDQPAAPVTAASARAGWVTLTNQRLQLAGKSLRVALEQEGTCAVVLAPGVEKPRQARPILTGKGEHQALFKSVVAMGFSRLVVRNPDSRREWAARLEKGKAVLED